MLNIIPMDLALDEIADIMTKTLLNFQKKIPQIQIFPLSQGSNNYVVQKNIISIPFPKKIKILS